MKADQLPQAMAEDSKEDCQVLHTEKKTHVIHTHLVSHTVKNKFVADDVAVQKQKTDSTDTYVVFQNCLKGQ